MTTRTRPPKPGPGYVWSDALWDWVPPGLGENVPQAEGQVEPPVEPEIDPNWWKGMASAAAEEEVKKQTPEKPPIAPSNIAVPPGMQYVGTNEFGAPEFMPLTEKLTPPPGTKLVGKNEFGGEEFLPELPPQPQKPLEPPKRKQDILFDIMKDVLPDMTVSYGMSPQQAADVAVNNLTSYMQEQPDQFIAAIQEKGWNPNTEALLLGVGFKWEQLKKIFPSIFEDEDVKNARKLSLEAPEQFIDMLRTTDRAKAEDLLIRMGATREQIDAILLPTQAPIKLPTLSWLDKVNEIKNDPSKLVPFLSSGKEIVDIARLLKAAKDLEDGIEVSKEDLLALKTYVDKAQQDTDWTYQIANILGQLPAFAGEFVATGGIFAAGQKIGIKAGTEALKRLLTKVGVKALEGKLAQFGIKLAGVAVGGTLRTIPAGITRIPAATLEKQLQALTITGDEESVFTSAVKALGEQWVEIVSESTGGLFPSLTKVAKGALVKAGLIKAMQKVNTGADVSDIQKVVKALGYNGVFEEMLEERVADVGHGVLAAIGLGDQPFKLPSLQQLGIELAAFSVPGVAIKIAEGIPAAIEEGRLRPERGSIGKVPEESDYTKFIQEGKEWVKQERVPNPSFNVNGWIDKEIEQGARLWRGKDGKPVSMIKRTAKSVQWSDGSITPISKLALPNEAYITPVKKVSISESKLPAPEPAKPEILVPETIKIPYGTDAYQFLLKDKISPDELKSRIEWAKKQAGNWAEKANTPEWAKAKETALKQAEIYNKNIKSMESLLPAETPVAQSAPPTAIPKAKVTPEVIKATDIPELVKGGFARKSVGAAQYDPSRGIYFNTEPRYVQVVENGVDIHGKLQNGAEYGVKVNGKWVGYKEVPTPVTEVAKPPGTQPGALKPVAEEVPAVVPPGAEGRNIPTPEQKASIPPNLPPSEQVAAHINFEPDKPSLKEQFESGKQKAIVHWIDRLYPIDKFVSAAKKTGIDLSIEENPYLSARLLEGVTSKATNFIENGTFGRQFWKMEKGKAVPNYKGEGLSQILESVSKPEDWKDFSVYLTSAHAQELDAIGIKTGISPDVALGAMRDMEAKHPDFPKMADKIQKYQSDLLDYVQESGLINQELRDKLNAKYYAYVPFYRVMDELASKGYMGKKMVDIASPIKRIKGSTREIINPLESIVKNTYAMINAADRNQVGVAMARIAHDVPAVSDMFRHIKTPIAKVATVTAKELGIEVEGLSEAETEEVFNVFRPSMFKAENVATVMIDGKKQFFEVDPDLNKALHALDSASMGILWKVLSAPAKWLRAGATLSPDFMIRNPMRDALSAFVYSKYGFIPGIDFMKGVASILKKDSAYQLYKTSGAEHSMLVSLDRDYLQSTFKQVVEGKKFTDYVKHPLALFQIASELGEKATRLGEFKKGLAQGATPLEAGMASREVTLDFAKAGTQARAVNQIIAFFNATIRGWDRPIVAFKEAPVRTSLKILAGITLPSIILWAVNHDDDRWKEIPQWQKDLFWIVMTKDTIYRIPKPFELGVIFGSGPERLLDYLYTKDPNMGKQFAENLIQTGIPGWLPTGLEPIIENITNHSFFRGTPIVSEGKANLPPEFQYTQYTSEVAKILGETGLAKLLKLTPLGIDNVIQGWTGGLGRYATQAIDIALRETGVAPPKIEPSPTAADIPVLRAFVVRNPIGGSSDSVNKFYDVLDDYTAQEQRMKMLLDEKKMTEYEAEKAKHPELLLNYDEKTNTVYSATTRYLRQVSGELSDIRKLQDKIFKSTDMSPEKKRELIDGIDTIKTQLAQKALALIKNPGGEAGILEVPAKDLENKLGTVLNPVPPISKDAPDVYRTPDLAKELDQVKGESKLKTLLEKNNKILTDIANLPDSSLYKIDRTVSKAGLTRIQNELLDRYDAAENKKAFIKAHPEVKINPKADWLKKNPESNAILALWGNAKILTQKAYDIAQDLIENNDVPENAFPLGTFPPKEVAKANFDYLDAVEKFGGTSVQARLIRTDDKFNEWLKLERIDEDVKGLELKVKNYDTTKKYETLSDKDSVDYIADETKRKEAQEKFKTDNPKWVEDNDRIQARSVGTRDKPTPDETVNKWVDKGKVARESKGYDAEEKVWYLDNPEIHKWALENKLITDDGSKWNAPVLRIQVKPENRKMEAEREKLKGDDEGLKKLMAMPVGKTWKDDQRRITAYQNDGTDFVESWVEHGKVSDEFGGSSAESKVWLYDHHKEWTWALGKKLLSDEGQDWNIPVLRLNVKWRKQDTEYDTILSKYNSFQQAEQDKAVAEYLSKNPEYRTARIRRNGYELGLSEQPLIGSKTGDKPPIEKWVEYGQLPESGYYRDRYRLDNPDFDKTVKAAQLSNKKDVWEDVNPAKVPNVRYDIITEQFKDLFKQYEEADVKGKRSILAGNKDFANARMERDAYKLLIGSERYVPNYMEYYKIVNADTFGDNYEDDWYLMEHPDFYNTMRSKLEWRPRDFNKVPSREVWSAYQVYSRLTTTLDRHRMRASNSGLDNWLYLTRRVSEKIDTLKDYEQLRARGGPSEVEAYKRYLGEEKLSSSQKKFKESSAEIDTLLESLKKKLVGVK